MSNPTSDSFVNMDVEAGTPAPKTLVHHVGETLALIELASIIIIGITSYTMGRDFNWDHFADYEENPKNMLLSYCLVVGIVSLVTCLVARFQNLGGSRPLAGFMSLWWCFGTGVMTFYGPYNNACNGYFAAWLGLIGSLLWTFPDTGGDKGERSQLAAMIGLSSAVLLIAVGYDQYGKYLNDPSTVFGLVVAAVSIFLAAQLGFITDLGARRDQILSGILALMWVSANIFMAWDHHGNALFSLFVGTLCSVKNLTRSVYKTSE